ncbi:MAG: DSD1 family PLP-dependent enzyme, partial [bacterium]
EACAALAKSVADSQNLELHGIMGYEGHAVMMNDRAAREEAAKKSMGVLMEARDCIADAGYPVNVVSAGGTGTYDMTGVYPGVTEIQVGSYIFMDARYRQTGTPFKNSLFIVATIISKPRPDLAIIDAGLKSMSSEFGMPEIRRPAGMRLAFLSEEHADVVVSGADFEAGDQVEIMPSHCCTTVNLHDKLNVIKDGKVENVWNIEARGKSV